MRVSKRLRGGRSFLKFFLIFFFFFPLITNSCEEIGTECLTRGMGGGIWIGEDSENIPEQVFYAIANDLKEMFAPMVAQRGKTLEIIANWPLGYANAQARRRGHRWIVEIGGGFARYHTMTPDALANIICHELGHHLGGLPRNLNDSLSWTSVEGQSDYFASQYCLKRYFRDDDNQSIVEARDIPEIVQEKCQNQYSIPNDIAICQRSAMAGFDALMTMDSIRRERIPQAFLPERPHFDNPSNEHWVRKTMRTYSSLQCRLDTFFQGALCPSREREGCPRINWFTVGARPTCWFFDQDFAKAQRSRWSR